MKILTAKSEYSTPNAKRLSGLFRSSSLIENQLLRYGLQAGGIIVQNPDMAQATNAINEHGIAGTTKVTSERTSEIVIE